MYKYQNVKAKKNPHKRSLFSFYLLIYLNNPLGGLVTDFVLFGPNFQKNGVEKVLGFETDYIVEV